jgi:hypothetical protein
MIALSRVTLRCVNNNFSPIQHPQVKKMKSNNYLTPASLSLFPAMTGGTTNSYDK